MDFDQKAAALGWRQNPDNPNYYFRQINKNQLMAEITDIDLPPAVVPTYETAEIIVDLDRIEKEFGQYLLIHMHRIVHRYENWWNKSKYPLDVHRASKSPRLLKLDRMLRRYLSIDS